VTYKRYYWLKLKNDFFKQREIKKLRSIAGGDTYTIIYLKLQLHSLVNKGSILFAETEDSIEEQLSYELDEDLNNIQITLSFLKKHRLIEMGQNQDISMIETKELIYSESESTSRVRRHRDKAKALQSNSNVTFCNKIVTIEQDIDIDIEKQTEQQTDCDSGKNIVSDNSPYCFDEASNQQRIIDVKNYLMQIGLTKPQIKRIIEEHPLSLIDSAIDSTLSAKKIKTTLPRYFYGVLNNSIKS
jgi:predicted phage replisome organizer